MRRLAFVSGIIGSMAVLAGPALGQSMSSGGINPRPTYGVMGGMNLASFHGDNASGLDNRVGFLLGGWAKVSMSAIFSIQPELMYTQKGAKLSMPDGSGGTVEASFKPSYIELPILARVDVPTAGQVKPFFQAGPALALKVGCTISASNGGVSGSASCSTAGEDVKSFDFGLLVGAGLDFRVGRQTMSAGVRYDHGLSDVVSGSGVKNKAFSFVLGYGF